MQTRIQSLSRNRAQMVKGYCRQAGAQQAQKHDDAKDGQTPSGVSTSGELKRSWGQRDSLRKSDDDEGQDSILQQKVYCYFQ